ncbi:E3 ubiquitin-protein ligase RNF34 isoform X2 [Frankliniella occidentalis]|nr:E3 ubiquitin-protein ligase RNF34 isoform X2 [Frankliniella occidentalis]XP_052122763.1 E3 ubiquitin-protein ligase RNF34 isoform X2 [Frankliniella occidentalis]XP_052122764.1 E3 ubiquitin-protein ligase RNF34 isoform X2 [Frankliniella occidentalis]
MAKETFSSLIDLFKSSSSVSTLVCDICGNKLSVFKKKKPCAECKRLFCSQCLQRCRDRALRCKNCCVLTMRPPMRSALLDLRIKDLQHYLNQHHVSTRGCLEKEDLVNVLLRYAATSGNPHPNLSSNPPGYSRNSAETSNSGPSPSNQTSSSSFTQVSTDQSARVRTQHSADPSQMPSTQTTSGNVDTDSSSDTSFEIVQRPSSEENIYSSSTSTSVTGGSNQSSPTQTNIPCDSSMASSSPVTEAVPPERGTSASNPQSPSSNQTPTTESASAIGSIPVPSLADAETSIIPEVIIETDVPNVENQQLSDINSQSSPSESNSSNNSPNLLRGTMASITSEADFESLSVKQLKDILHRHRVNYFGCCEKAELVDKAKRLYRDYCSSRAELEKLDMDALCKICMDAPVECVMLECGHMATCTDCGRQLSECPICRQFVVRIVRTFKA